MPERVPAGENSYTPLTLRTLGEASLSRQAPDEPARPLLPVGKPLALVAYLACVPSRSATRERLVDLLWGDVDPEAGKHALRQTLWYIRQRVGEEVLSAARGGTVALAAPLACDRDAFLEAIGRDDPERAVELYGGDFLPGFAAPGGAELERWADVERLHLRAHFVRAGETVARRWLTAGRPREAQALARRVRDADPGAESGWRLLLEMLGGGGDPVGAAVEADRLERMLAEEERTPEPATRAALRAARRVPGGSGAPEGGASGLVAELTGREGEFAAILAGWEAARRGGLRHIHLVAPAGVGKSRLLHEVRNRLAALRARVVLARANPGERAIAYALAGEIAAALARLPGAAGISPDAAASLVALDPRLSSTFRAAADPSAGEEALRRRTLSLAELLGAVADEAPLVLLVDDLHWADARSRQLLQGVLAKARGAPALVVTAARPTAHPLLEPEPEIVRALPPLDAAQLQALVASIGMLPPEPWAARLPDALHAASGGSPLLALESLQLAVERGALVLAERRWRAPDPTALAALLGEGAALRHRLERLAPVERRALLSLAVAGAPAEERVVARVAADGEGRATLAALERRGLAERAGEAWRPAHDAIAEAALAAAAPDEPPALHAALGAALAAEAGGDARLLLRAGRHLALGGDEGALRRAFAAYVASARAEGGARTLAELAAEVLGDAATPARRDALVRSLPLRQRWRLTTTRAAALAALVLVPAAGIAAAVWMRDTTPPDAVLIAVALTGPDSARPRQFEIRRERWGALDALDLDDFDDGARVVPADAIADIESAHESPRGGEWIFDRDVPEPGILDIWLATARGEARPLVTFPRDDVSPSWSPDGRQVVFASSRWDELMRYDIAVLDRATGRVRRVTRGDHADMQPRWSPDGTRIAFVRQPADDGPAQLCIVAQDGAGAERCMLVAERPIAAVLAWTGEDHVLASVIDGGHVLHRVDVRDGSSVEIFRGSNVSAPVASPDGAWLAVRAGGSGTAGGWLVFPAEAPSLAKRVVLGERRAESVVLRWRSLPRRPAWLDSIVVRAPAVAPLGVGTRLQARGLDASGRPIPLRALAWRSLDSAVATVDSSGTLWPRRAGVAVVEVSAGGWRRAVVRVPVAAPRDSTVLRESWSDTTMPAWVPFGSPRPAIVTGPDGAPAFLNNGDGSYVSGAYTRQRWDPSRGLGVEARISAPVTIPQWQRAELSLRVPADSAWLAAWDHRTGYWPDSRVEMRAFCALEAPVGQGRAAMRELGMEIGGRGIVSVPDSAATSGRWFTARVQLFPDGRCGLAIDGRPVWVSADAIPLGWPLRAVVAGNSFRTRMLHGPVEVWTGVRADIDWRAADTARIQ